LKCGISAGEDSRSLHFASLSRGERLAPVGMTRIEAVLLAASVDRSG
jgi:hypothetical protein